MLDTNDPNYVGTAVSAIIFGVVLLTEYIFLFIAVKVDTLLYRPVARLLIQQSAIGILLAACLLQQGFFHFVFHKQESKCIVSQVSGDFTKTLVCWNTALLALYSVGLHGRRTILQELIKSWVFQGCALGSVWLLSVLVILSMYLIEHPFKDNKCETLSSTSLVIRAVSDVASFVLLVVLLLVVVVKIKRCARVLHNGQSGCIDDRIAKRGLQEMAGSLDALCWSFLFLSLGTVVLRLVHVSGIHPPNFQNHALSLLAYVLWHLALAVQFPVLMQRHLSLRKTMRRTVCQKCFLYHTGTFGFSVEDTYGRAAECREMMKDSHVRESVARQKKKSIEALAGLEEQKKKMSGSAV